MYQDYQYSSNSKDTFDYDDPNIWITYPYGCSGDLIASIVSMHLYNTGVAQPYRGIKDNGQVHFQSSDGRIIGTPDPAETIVVLENAFDNTIHGTFLNNLNDQFDYAQCEIPLFVNHAFTQLDTERILKKFPQSKVIRIIPRNNYENGIRVWMGDYKNINVISGLPEISEIDNKPNDHEFVEINNSRVITLYFGDIFSEESFELFYDRIVDFLDLKHKLIRYDFIKHYVTKQHPLIQPALWHLKQPK